MEMQTSVQSTTICKNPSTDKDTTRVSKTMISSDMQVIYDTINVQPPEQNADIYENPSANDIEMTKAGTPNPVQLRAKENPYSFDTSTENTPTLCTADHDDDCDRVTHL